MERRSFLVRTGLALGAGVLARSSAGEPPRAIPTDPDWAWVRDQFAFTREKVNMACMLIASHPREVRDAVERHRRGFDEDPISYLMANFMSGEGGVLAAAAEYMSVEPTDIALTMSTTMGLGLLYGGLSIREDQEILTTYHDHVATDAALQYKAQASGATIRRVRLYDPSQRASVDAIVDTIQGALSPRTRILALTYVHSTSGVKLPIREIAEVVDRVNEGRSEDERLLFCVDGVHGFGVEDVSMDELGCDFFVAGTHKWIFGPNGTGLVWGKPELWKFTQPTMASADYGLRIAWMQNDEFAMIRQASALSPGGLGAWEHRWAVAEAFRFHLNVGKTRIARRIHGLATQLKEGLQEMGHVTLRTPMSPELSAGIVCFDVDGMSAEDVISELGKHGIIGTTSAVPIEETRPYHVHHARLTPGLLNTEDEVEQTLTAIRDLATA